MKRLMTVMAFLAVAGCHNPTAAQLVGLQVTAPVAGQMFEIGTPVTISWVCYGCQQIYGSGGVMLAVVSDKTGAVTLLGPVGSFVGSVQWNAGQTPGGTLSPGPYHITVDTYPDYSASASSPSFTLIVTG